MGAFLAAWTRRSGTADHDHATHQDPRVFGPLLLGGRARTCNNATYRYAPGPAGQRVSASSFHLLAAIQRLGNLAASGIAPSSGPPSARTWCSPHSPAGWHSRSSLSARACGARAIATRWRSPPASWGRSVRSRNQVGTAQRTPDPLDLKEGATSRVGFRHERSPRWRTDRRSRWMTIRGRSRSSSLACRPPSTPGPPMG
jgi:hypothetical protein